MANNGQTTDGDTVALPQKRFYRQRAHANPRSDHSFEYPSQPALMDWKTHYPEFENYTNGVEILDIGCGYGGLLLALSKLYPDKLSLGLEIRVKVSDYVNERIRALRLQEPGKWQNISVLRANAMKFLPHFFKKGQLSKMYFCFPDPHFKKAKHKWRIISHTLLTEYAHLLRTDGGRLYIITDVFELYEWMTYYIDRHPAFSRLSEEDATNDPAAEIMWNNTEEGKKVERNQGSKWIAVYNRVRLPDAKYD
eukprot:Clim_evm20s70 gene=Clim_evmTU20s70